MTDALKNKLNEVGFDVIGELNHSQAKVRVRCKSCGDEFVAQYQKIRSGARSCACAKQRRKVVKFRKSFDQLHAIAESKGGRLLTEIPLASHGKWKFECAEQHVWSAQGQSIKMGTWCPRCSGNFPRSIAELREIASSRGGKLLSTEYKGVDATYEFECSLGHEFRNMFKKVEGGQWCPTCNKGTKSEEIARATFEALFGLKFRKVRPPWLRNSRGRLMELDGYCAELGIAFEYQGVQHFKDVGVYSTDLPQRIADDQRKFSLCAENGIRLFYLTFEDAYEDYPKRIALQAQRFGIDVSDIDFESPIDLSSAYIRDDRTDEFRALLAAKNIKLLSARWLTSDAKYSLECLECGNQWQAQGNMFFNSRRVAGCQVCMWKQVAEQNRGTIQDLADYAKQFGGTSLSTKYTRRNHNYLWRCAQGHEFEASFNNMQFRNQFCPYCEGRTRRSRVTPEQVEAKFKQSGLEVLERPTGKKREWLKVRCTVCGDEFTNRYEKLENGSHPCKSCAYSTKAEEATRIMLSAGVKPVEPFVNASTPWLGECQACLNRVSPTLANVKKGQGACIHCARRRQK